MSAGLSETLARNAEGPRPEAGVHPSETMSVKPTSNDPTVIALRLALGWEVDHRLNIDWVAVLSISLRERLGGVAWLRSGPAIRAAAPRDVVDRWRTLAVVIDERGRERLEALRSACECLDQAGCDPIVLKGMPLSQRLYGNPFVRASDDIDLFVRAAHRSEARQALASNGWHHLEGAAPWDELFARDSSPRLYLEIHQGLVTDYLAHIAFPEPTHEIVDLEACRVRGFAGAAEPAYLAAHLAGHQLTPLLWGLDFMSLWEGRDQPERDDARQAARSLGLERYLEWAIEHASVVNAAAGGDAVALHRLGVRGADRVDSHFSMWRHARLASGPFDAARAVAACVWPRPIRWDVGAFAKRLLWAIRYRGGQRDGSAEERAREVRLVAGAPASQPRTQPLTHRSLAGRFVSSQESQSPGAVEPGDDPRRGFKLSGSATLEVVREAISIAGSARVRAAGMSMWPTLGNGSVVTVVALPRNVRRGQIVLMDWNGMPVLHRVLSVTATDVITGGDACVDPDPPTPRSRVCALAVSVSDERGTVTLVGSLEHGIGSWLMHARLLSRLSLARAWRRLRRSSRPDRHELVATDHSQHSTRTTS